MFKNKFFVLFFAYGISGHLDKWASGGWSSEGADPYDHYLMIIWIQNEHQNVFHFLLSSGAC